MTSWSRNRSTVGCPARETWKFGKDVEFFPIFFPLFKMFGNHPPTVIKDLSEILVWTKKFWDISLQKRSIIFLIEPAIKFRPISI